MIYFDFSGASALVQLSLWLLAIVVGSKTVWGTRKICPYVQS